jgi:hypothetical protein
MAMTLFPFMMKASAFIIAQKNDDLKTPPLIGSRITRWRTRSEAKTHEKPQEYERYVHLHWGSGN